MNIQSKDISIVIQGPIDWSIDQNSLEPITLTCCRNIRSLLPNAEIILSTWKKELTKGLDYDKIIISEIPDQQGNWPSWIPNNVNRQIVSTISGLNSATRQYCLKIRTDMILMGTDFIKHFEERRSYKKNLGADSIFKNAVVTNNLSSRNSKSILKRLPDHPLPFHFSDHVQFGNICDLKTLWDIPLQNDDEANFFHDRSHPNKWRLHELSRLSPEQYILTSAIKKSRPLDIKDYADGRDEILKLSEYYLKSHFVILPDISFPVSFPKYHTIEHFRFEWMRISHLAFLQKEKRILFNSDDIKWKGFSNPENGFRWTDNFYSSMEFEWEGEDINNGLFEICFDTYKKQNVTLLFNGLKILEANFNSNNNISKVNISDMQNGTNTIEFILPDARIPDHGDTRRIAIALRQIIIKKL
jgi:hypothetical protein